MVVENGPVALLITPRLRAKLCIFFYLKEESFYFRGLYSEDTKRVSNGTAGSKDKMAIGEGLCRVKLTSLCRVSTRRPKWTIVGSFGANVRNKKRKA